MRKINLNLKGKIIEKALKKNEVPLIGIAKENNIGYSTLLRWIRSYHHEKEDELSINKKSHTSLTDEEKFKHLVATDPLDEVKLGAYCREHGLYAYELDEWRKIFMGKTVEEKKAEYQADLKALKEKNKQLEKDLKRKDKALSEVSALLVLKKKADLIWGVKEDD